ncbi:class I SAM-dependent rRNA methyltransferase [Dongia sp.]|uniref:class I SAM-dependent rRNA methyltransferase n=1 Tax=Dongia sp. TaxID=1977262 RepID=UPI0035B36422
MSKRPTIHLKAGEDRRILGGHPWVYSNELQMSPEVKAIAPGSIVTLRHADGRPLGLALFNPKSLISGRLITRDPAAVIDAAFWQARLERAWKLRERMIGVPFYRLAHAEADGLPGCVIDRYGDVFVIDVSSAGMEQQIPHLGAAIDALFNPRVILVRGDGPARELEGLAPASHLLKGSLDDAVALQENGAEFLSDPRAGQKTGWFYDQRDNRALIARLAAGRTMLDAYCYMGGFAIQALRAGATSALALDRSAPALALAKRAAVINGVADQLQTRQSEAFEALAEMSTARQRFDIVVADPPAFVKSRKDFHQGAKAYRKLARLAAQCVAPDGILMLCSCSHNMPADEFLRQTHRGIQETGRHARLLYHTGAAPDHPVHPGLPESAYLKALTFAIE